MKHRFVVLDMFRGLFASLVVFYHMSAFSETKILNNNFIMNCDMFVDFFFVLSGFVICYSYKQIDHGAELGSFLYKRIIRLYPLHVLMLMIFLLIEGAKLLLINHVQINNSLDNTTLTFFTSLFLLNAVYFPGVRDISWNMVSWSISAELISYIVFAFVCFWLSQKRLRKLKPWVYFLIVVTSVLTILFITGEMRLDYTYDLGFLRGLIGFFSGAVCFYAFDYLYPKLKKVNNLVFTLSEILLAVLVVFLIIKGKQIRSYGLVFELAFLLSVFIFAFEKGLISKSIGKVTLFKKMGQYSYSIYMIHTLFISVFNVLFIRVLNLPPTAYSYLFIINYLVIYLVAGWTYQNIEMRFQDLLRPESKKSGLMPNPDLTKQ